MITGVHAVIFTTDAEQDRAFFRDVLELPFVDAGEGWLIFSLLPAELAAHPAEEDGRHGSTSCATTSMRPSLSRRPKASTSPGRSAMRGSGS